MGVRNAVCAPSDGFAKVWLVVYWVMILRGEAENDVCMGGTEGEGLEEGTEGEDGDCCGWWGGHFEG